MMKKIFNSLRWASLFLFASTGFADDLPTSVQQGAEIFDKDMCIQQYSQNCISTICITSSDRNCQEKCRSDAKDKCEEQANQ